MLKKIQNVFVELLLLFIFSVKGLYATDLFYDNFDSLDANKWNYVSNGGEIVFNNSIMELSSSGKNFPIITNSSGLLLNNFENAVIEFRFNYKYLDFMGNGIGVGYTSVDGFPNYQFSIWNDSTNGPKFQYRDVGLPIDGKCDYSTAPLLKESLEGKILVDTWNVFRIEKYGKMFKIFLNSENIYSSNVNQCVPVTFFIGNPLQGGVTEWTKLNIDYVKVSTDATSAERNKIIILPGLGASWNPEAILLGNSDSSLKWSMTPFVRNYDLLIDTLKNNNLVENEDFYVWNYEWRKPLSQIVTDFNSYVQSLNLGSNEKIDLVGHSLGGLVARLWTQDHLQLVGKAISLGSPHYGSLKAYEAWNAAKFGDNLDISTIALNVLLQLQKKNGDNSVTALRRFSPIVFDLSPTFNFLKKNGVEVLAEKSEYLVEKNNSVADITNSLSTIDGLGVQTKEWINVGNRGVVDKVLGIWSEGRPISYDFADGDGTVLKKSALIPGSENVDFNSNHGALVDISTNWIMSKLGLGITTSGNTSYPDKGLTFYLGSPASMQVKCGEIVNNDDRGWIIIENKEIGDCSVTLTGKDEGGIYHLVVGRGNEWKYFEGEIKKDEKINFLVNQIEDSWQILKKDFKEIGASRALKAAEKKNILETTAYYMTYRLVKDDFKFSEEILKNLEIILGGKKTSKYENKMMYQRAKQQYKLVKARIELMTKKGMKLSYPLAINFAEAESLMGLESDYAGNYLAEKLLIISWMK